MENIRPLMRAKVAIAYALFDNLSSLKLDKYIGKKIGFADLKFRTRELTYSLVSLLTN